jgi:hypothetical protein
VLNAIKIPCPDGTFRRTDSPAALAAALGAGWAPTFAVIKPTDVDLMTSYVQLFAARLPWHLATPPGVLEYTKFLKSAHDTAPGEDGLPYSAWTATGLLGAQTLCDVGNAQMSGLYMPLSYYVVIKCFPPKGSDPDDAVSCERTVEDTRPLALLNSDR